MTQLVKINDWVDALNGIGQVLSIKQIYRENYPLTSRPPKNNQQSGLINTIVIHKVFCDFDGKIRKNNVVQHCSLEVCTPISDDSVYLLSKLKQSKSKEIEKFTMITQTKDIDNFINTWIRVKSQQAQRIANYLNEEFDSPAFHFSDMCSAQNSCRINSQIIYRSNYLNTARITKLLS